MAEDGTGLAYTLYDRTLPTSDDPSPAGEGGGVSTFNLMFIVGFAILISVLAGILARRGRK